MTNTRIPTFDIYKKIESDLQFECWTLEETHNPYDSTQPHRHNYYEIFFFEKSGGVQEIDFNAYPVKKNMLHFISPEQVHLLKRKSTVDGYVLSFTKEFCSVNSVGEISMDDFPFFNTYSSSPILELKKSVQKKTILELIHKIKSEFHSKHNDKANALRSYLHILLIELRRMYQPANKFSEERTAQQELLRKFKLLIERNFIHKKSVSEFAEIMCISPGHLNDTVHSATGRTASDLIHERIILEAKRLLYHSDQSVKEIAHHLNFDDPSYFARFFKTHASLTPDEFRHQIRERYH